MTEPFTPVTRKNRLMQIEVFPQRLLNFETARDLLGELNRVAGITRMIVHGPRLPKGDPEKMLNGQFDAETKYLDVMGERGVGTLSVHCTIDRDVVFDWQPATWTVAGKTTEIATVPNLLRRKS